MADERDGRDLRRLDKILEGLKEDYYRIGQDDPDIKALFTAAQLVLVQHGKAQGRDGNDSTHRDEIVEMPLWVLVELSRHLARWLQDEDTRAQTPERGRSPATEEGEGAST